MVERAEAKYNLDIATEDQQERIKELEQISMGSAQLAEAVLVLLGVKPTTELELSTWNDSPDKVRDVLSRTGLVVKEVPFNNEEGKLTAKFLIGKDPEQVRLLETADPSKDHEVFGRLMGYPETAVAAFLGKIPRMEHKKQDELLKSSVFQPALSAEHGEEEAKLFMYWTNLIKKYAPHLYQELGGE